MATLDELMAEYEPERLAEIAKDETPEAKAKTLLKREAEIQKEIKQGLRDSHGDWIEQPELNENEEDEESNDDE